MAKKKTKKPAFAEETTIGEEPAVAETPVETTLVETSIGVVETKKVKVPAFDITAEKFMEIAEKIGRDNCGCAIPFDFRQIRKEMGVNDPSGWRLWVQLRRISEQLQTEGKLQMQRTESKAAVKNKVTLVLT